jgi:hypothetical protein
MDREDIEPEEQVVAELAFAHRLAQIDILIGSSLEDLSVFVSTLSGN